MTATVEQYPVGTVALATVRGTPNIRVFLYTHPASAAYACWCSSEPVDGMFLHSSAKVADVAPLALIRRSDVGDTKVYLRLAAVHAKNEYAKENARRIANVLEDQLIDIEPALTPEPASLLARVEDRDSSIWAPWNGKWYHLTSGVGKGPRSWEELSLVHGPLTVLRDG